MTIEQENIERRKAAEAADKYADAVADEARSAMFYGEVDFKIDIKSAYMAGYKFDKMSKDLETARTVVQVLEKAHAEGIISKTQWWRLVMLFATEIDEITKSDYKE